MASDSHNDKSWNKFIEWQTQEARKEQKSMKIIDLLNKIANGEDVPKEIGYSRKCYYLTNNHDIDEFGGAIGMFALNDEIEILDEDYIEDTPKISKLYINNKLQYDLTPKEDKKIKRLGKCFFTEYDDMFTEWVATYNGVIVDKLNEIIDRLNGEDNE